MIRNRKEKTTVFLVVMIFAMMAMAGSAAALQFNLGENTTLDVDTSLTYAAGWRVKDQQKNPSAAKFGALGYANSNDGNNSLDKWNMINNKMTALVDINLQHKNFGIFLRPKAFHDQVYMSDNANEDMATNNNFIAKVLKNPLGSHSPDEFDSKTEDAHGQNVELLDAFVYANFDVADRNVNIRVGRQVISWGESLFLQGGIASAQSHIDISNSNTPGRELKELFLPSESAYIQADITDTISLSGYYQWKWEKHRFSESGSFFSTSDVIDEAGHVILHPLVPTGVWRAEDDEPSDSGQFGVSLTYIADWLLGTEFGLYYLNYHEKAPGSVLAIPNYYLKFAEDVKLYGASISSMIGQVNVSGEISYRKDFPVAMEAPQAPENANILQAQVSWVYLWGSAPVCDSLTVMGEVGYNKVMGLENDRLNLGKEAWGFSITATPAWIQILPRLDMKMPITYKANPMGKSSVGGTFTEGVDSGSIGLDLTYNNVYVLGFKYADYFNEKRNVLSDRDNVSVTLKYTF
jgi:hypothetical protein